MDAKLQSQVLIESLPYLRKFHGETVVIKYGGHAMKDEGALHIRVTVRGCEGDALSIEVADDGAGMDEETAVRLFDASMPKLDTSAPQGGGAGVAMRNISERIKRFYGPRSFARVDSRPGEGTTITLHLDLLQSIFDEG